MRGHLRSTHAEFFLNYTIIKCIVILSVCQMIGSNISDITYSVKQNGVMLSLDYTEPIGDDDIIGWKSDRGWIYLTLLGVSYPKHKSPQKLLGEDIKKIVIDDFDQSTQIAILLKKPILGYDIINSNTTPSTIIFIHTKIRDSHVATIKKRIKENGESYFNLSEKSTFPKYNTNFKKAFDQARKELGQNAIFNYHGKLYTTNHPHEKYNNTKSLLIDKVNTENKKSDSINEIYTDSKTGEKIVESFSPIHKYSFFKDKIIEEKISNSTDNDSTVNTFGNRSELENQNGGIINDFLKGDIVNSIKDKIRKTPEEMITNGDLFYYPDKSIKKEKENWLNDNFPKVDKTYSGYDPKWSFPDDRESLDYHPKEEIEFDNPESFPKREVDQVFSYFYRGGIKISSNMSGVPIYIDGKYVGDTPINKPIQVEPGWHQVSGFSPFYKRLSSMNILQYINFDPVIQNNESYGSETTYVESGKIATVRFKFNHMGDTPKKWREINGGMSIGAPIISFIFGLIIWGIA